MIHGYTYVQPEYVATLVSTLAGPDVSKHVYSGKGRQLVALRHVEVHIQNTDGLTFATSSNAFC